MKAKDADGSGSDDDDDNDYTKKKPRIPLSPILIAGGTLVSFTEGVTVVGMQGVREANQFVESYESFFGAASGISVGSMMDLADLYTNSTGLNFMAPQAGRDAPTFKESLSEAGGNVSGPVTTTISVGFDSSVTDTSSSKNRVNASLAVLNKILEADGRDTRFGAAFDFKQDNKTAPSSLEYHFNERNQSAAANRNWAAINSGVSTAVSLLVTEARLYDSDGKYATGVTLGRNMIVFDEAMGRQPILLHELGHVGGFQDPTNRLNPTHSSTLGHIMQPAPSGLGVDLPYLSAVSSIPRDKPIDP